MPQEGHGIRSSDETNLPLARLLLEVDQPWWRTFPSNVRDALFSREPEPLQLTAKPAADVVPLNLDLPWWRSLMAGLRDELFPEKLPPLNLTSRPVAVRNVHVAKPWWQSLAENLRDTLFPEKLPPLVLTSRPVPVRDLWGTYDYRRKGMIGTLVIHGAFAGMLIGVSIAGARVARQVQGQQVVSLAAPDVSVYMPLSNKVDDRTGGGGGGGDRDKLQAPKGKLPKAAMHQFTPPAVILRNENPKLAMEPTVVIPPEVRLPEVNLPNMGDPLAAVAAVLSNGTGSGGGIGTGSGGGVGSGDGPGFGQGRGGGTGGGVFQVGGGISAPRPVFTPDPEYSEPARRAKHQGIVVLWMVVGADGRPREVRVSRSLGMGLDEKAIEAVRQWKFEPARRNGVAVAVRINVEVDFKLY